MRNWFLDRLKSICSEKFARSGGRSARRRRLGGLETLEQRLLMTTFVVSNLESSGAGSFRQAILSSNAHGGSNTIDFAVSGTIQVGAASLPSITSSVTIDGTSAPSFSHTPVVTVNFQGTQGLTFAAGSNGSKLESLSLVNSGGAGVTLTASNVTLQGNYIGLLANGTTVAANKGDGIHINAQSSSDLIGSEQPVNNQFQLSNLISGNLGNGIGLYGASDNVISMNEIGTDVSGTLNRGNGQNGILITQGASGNLIGGDATGGNDPTNSVFVRPPEGNLISGNAANGVLITAGATQNTLSGNFIGTAASGNSALGNTLDGVAILGANGNQLIGCLVTDDPFVFYNVLSGNGGNGLRITNSNNTTVQANFMGVGANNATLVANGGDGLLVSGTSSQTQVGGVIPLGNVISGNDQNGIEVKDTANNFTSFNTFAGIFAFGDAAPNKLDGTLITSSGGNNVIRTCIISGNLGNGIELAGNATGVQVTDTAIGTDTNIETAVANGGDGIKITGNAYNNAIGGFQVSVEQQVTISSNQGYGIEIVGNAHNNSVFHTNVGTGGFGVHALGNGLGGIYIGKGTYGTTLGGTTLPYRDVIENNQGAGVTIDGSSGNILVGSLIAKNTGNGVVVTDGLNNQIGTAGNGNTISSNGENGVTLSGRVAGTKVQANTISSNGANGIMLVNTKMTFIGGSALPQGNLLLQNSGYGIDYQGDNQTTVQTGNQFIGNGEGETN